MPRIRVFNKIDHVGDATAQAECEAALRAKYPDCVVMSARRPDDVARLHKAVVAFFQRDLVEAELFLPWSAQQLRKDIHTTCEVMHERADHEGAFFRVRGESEALSRLRNIRNAVNESLCTKKSEARCPSLTVRDIALDPAAARDPGTVSVR